MMHAIRLIMRKRLKVVPQISMARGMEGVVIIGSLVRRATRGLQAGFFQLVR